WEREVHCGVPRSSHHLKNTYASETPATDGERVYAYFGNLGMFVLIWMASRSGNNPGARFARATAGARRRRPFCIESASTLSTTTTTGHFLFRWTSEPANRSGAWSAMKPATGRRRTSGRTN